MRDDLGDLESLGLIGIDGDKVKDVILTHLHYDHVGNFHRFPAAQFHLREPEMAYATSRYMRHEETNSDFRIESATPQ